MKYLEHLGLERISNIINTMEFGGGVCLHGRVEIYSTKKSVEDKKHSKVLESKLASADSPMNIVQNTSPPITNSKHIFQTVPTSLTHESSPDKNTTEIEAKKTRKMLVDLIQTLNAAQLDHDFSELSQESFIGIQLNDAINHINSYLAEVCVKQPSFVSTLWKEIDSALSNTLSQCEVYKLADESYSEDLEEGITSSFHYFFCNKDLKRLCYFNCHTTCKYRDFENGEDDMDVVNEDSFITSHDEGDEENDNESYD
jgi:hypothetical protein